MQARARNAARRACGGALCVRDLRCRVVATRHPLPHTPNVCAARCAAARIRTNVCTTIHWIVSSTSAVWVQHGADRANVDGVACCCGRRRGPAATRRRHTCASYSTRRPAARALVTATRMWPAPASACVTTVPVTPGSAARRARRQSTTPAAAPSSSGNRITAIASNSTQPYLPLTSPSPPAAPAPEAATPRRGRQARQRPQRRAPQSAHSPPTSITRTSGGRAQDASASCAAPHAVGSRWSRQGEHIPRHKSIAAVNICILECENGHVLRVCFRNGFRSLFVVFVKCISARLQCVRSFLKSAACFGIPGSSRWAAPCSRARRPPLQRAIHRWLV